MGWSPGCYIPSFVQIGSPILEKKILKGFYHIWAWLPSWSCDQDHVNKVSLPLPMEAPHKISTLSTKPFQRRRSLNLLTTTDDGWMTEHGDTISSSVSLRLRLGKKQYLQGIYDLNKKTFLCLFLRYGLREEALT